MSKKYFMTLFNLIKIAGGFKFAESFIFIILNQIFSNLRPEFINIFRFIFFNIIAIGENNFINRNRIVLSNESEVSNAP